jgi:hypothetical protein
MKKVFEIECSEAQCEYLDLELNHLIQNDRFSSCELHNITDEITKLRRVVAALFDESDTRVPKGFDQKSDDYAMRVSAHNLALIELTKALQDVGYRE